LRVRVRGVAASDTTAQVRIAIATSEIFLIAKLLLERSYN
jgi:hypothetical protein